MTSSKARCRREPLWSFIFRRSFDVQIAVLTFDGFNELDSFVAAAILNRLRGQGCVSWR